MTTLSKLNILYLTALLLLLILSHTVNKQTTQPTIKISKQQSAININHELINILSLGQNRLISDFLWITTLLESDLEHYKSKDLNSWMYHRFNSIIEVDPNFLQAYQYGGKYLSIIKDDLIGAENILKKGVLAYPDDYEILNSIAFLYAFELYDYPNALKFYSKLSKSPKAPVYVKSIMLKLQYGIDDDLSIILPLIKEMYKNEPEDSFLKERLKIDLYAITSELDLECLNNNRKNCSKRDIDGNLYILSNGKYQAPKEFTPYKTIMRKN